MWTYFYFYNDLPAQTIYVEFDSLNGGDADVYLGRGKDSRPNQQNYVSRSFGFKSTYLEYTLEQSQSR